MTNERVLTNESEIPSLEELGFGRYYTPYIYLRYYKEGRWQEHEVRDYEPIGLDPAAQTLHYGQAIFEGMKAYYNKDRERIFLFRPLENAKRYYRSAERLCMPGLPTEEFLNSVVEAVKFSRQWIPPFTKANPTPASLYIRPFMIGITPKLGVMPSDDYLHAVITSPSGPYFPSGLKPIRLKVEEKYIRAARGGTGDAKAAGNYAASLLAAHKAKKEGYAQVLWLDAVERKYIEEVGAMNVMMVKNDVLVTPRLSGSILEGITRKSILDVAEKHLGMKIEERPIAMEELIEGIQDGSITEFFGTGTAAVVTPVGILGYKGREYVINDGDIGRTTLKLYETLQAVQYGELELPFAEDWVMEVK